MRRYFQSDSGWIMLDESASHFILSVNRKEETCNAMPKVRIEYPLRT
jgi:hypothetical protein